MVDVSNHVKNSTTHPELLQTNSTSHRWVFGAFAELIDNAVDPDVSASQFCIDMKEFGGQPCLVFMDNGCGLVPEKVHKMLSFASSKKVDLNLYTVTINGWASIDEMLSCYPERFKALHSATMRLGKDILVLTKCADSMTAGFLSQTFLAHTGAEEILIPRVSWDLNGHRLSSLNLEIEENLRAICMFTIFSDEESLLAQFEAIPHTGTIFIISNLKRHQGILELDFDTDLHDIRISPQVYSSQIQLCRPNEPSTKEMPMDSSLRAYVSILYKVPRIQIFIRDKKVKTKRMAGILAERQTEFCKPFEVAESIKIEIGFNTECKNRDGMMLYHHNRLIKSYVQVGMQLDKTERGRGVLGLADASFLQPTQSKQDFDDENGYRHFLKKLSDVLDEFWRGKYERHHGVELQQESQECRLGIDVWSPKTIPDAIWVQCDNPACLKWRMLPSGTDTSSLPDIWYCEYHPDEKFRRHEEAEQKENQSADLESSESWELKREYEHGRKKRGSMKKRQCLEYAALVPVRDDLNPQVALREAEPYSKDKGRKACPLGSDQRISFGEDEREMLAGNGHIVEGEDSLASSNIRNDPEATTLKQHVQHLQSTQTSRLTESEAAFILPNFESAHRHEDIVDSRGEWSQHKGPEAIHPQTSGTSQRALPYSESFLPAAKEMQCAKSSHVYFPNSLAVQGTSESPQHLRYEVTSLSPASCCASDLTLTSADHCKSHFQAGNPSQPSAELATTQDLPRSSQGFQIQCRAPSGEVRPETSGSGPSPSSPVALSSALPPVSLEASNPAVVTASRSDSDINEQSSPVPTLARLRRSWEPADAALDNQLSLPSPFNGGSSEPGREELVRKAADRIPDINQSGEIRLEQHLSSEVRAPVSGLRLAVPRLHNFPLDSAMLSVQLPMDSMVSSSNGRSEAELTLDKAVFSLQRQLRLALNTLLKLGGSADAQLIELDGLPSQDSEVVSICEKAKHRVETMMQASRLEAEKLKAELAYSMADKMQDSKGRVETSRFKALPTSGELVWTRPKKASYWEQTLKAAD